MKQRTCTLGSYQECLEGYVTANGTNYSDVYYFNNSLDNILSANGGLVSTTYTVLKINLSYRINRWTISTAWIEYL